MSSNTEKQVPFLFVCLLQSDKRNKKTICVKHMKLCMEADYKHGTDSVWNMFCVLNNT
jgi:hypothetical protein